jgi:hypothetical protein
MSTADCLNSYRYSNIFITAGLGSVSSFAAIPHFSTEKQLSGGPATLGPLPAYLICPVCQALPTGFALKWAELSCPSEWNMYTQLALPTSVKPSERDYSSPLNSASRAAILGWPVCVRSTNQPGVRGLRVGVPCPRPAALFPASA